MERSRWMWLKRKGWRRENMEMRVSIRGLKTLVYPSLHPFVPSQKQGRRERKERKLSHYGRGGLQSEVLGLLALSRIISIINSLSFHSFVSIFTFFPQSREQVAFHCFFTIQGLSTLKRIVTHSADRFKTP